MNLAQIIITPKGRHHCQIHCQTKAPLRNHFAPLYSEPIIVPDHLLPNLTREAAISGHVCVVLDRALPPTLFSLFSPSPPPELLPFILLPNDEGCTVFLASCSYPP